MFIIDAHLDLAYNALKYNRDLRLPLADLRQSEADGPQPNGRATVTVPTLIEAGAGLVFGTIFAAPADHPLIVPDSLTAYRTPEEAHRVGMRQLDYYHRLADEDGRVRLVTNLAQLEAVVASHQPGQERLLGIVPLMEGAEPVREPAEVELWVERGVRLIGPAWDDTRYAPGGWKAGGSLPFAGRRLLERMDDLNLILDLTHMGEQASLEALDRYQGRVVATHSNARALAANSQRQLSDQQIRQIAAREGVIGIVPFNVFLRPDHRRGDAKELVTLTHVVAHIDYMCQLIGDARHVGLGSDFDGGFGAADIPAEMDSAADFPLIGQALQERGYEPADVTNIMGGNWLRLLRQAWRE
jgi:membrane dipeptidase